MKERKNKWKKILMIIAIMIMNGIGFMNAVYAAPTINSANLYSIGDCGQLLKYKGTVVKTDFVQYDYQGVNYPAYCIDKTKVGVQEGGYTVSVQQAINDVGLWRVIVNGYPYKSIQELGVANKEEAFTATKQAVYCYIHENRPEDYEAIGEAGNRTLQALYKIVKAAENSTETKISSTLTINALEEKWDIDEINKEYVSKKFSVTAGANIQNYKITITKENAENIGGIKVTNLQNQEKSEFSSNEKFKVLIPIKNMTQQENIQLSVESKVQTKPILYGAAPHSSRQDYALTAATYEDGVGKKGDTYPKNETEIIIIKEDEKTKEKLEGVEFELLDEKKNVVYADLKTDKEGKIEIKNLLPGKYYIRETRAKDGYLSYEELIEVEVSYQEKYTVTINNSPEEKPKIKIERKEDNKEVNMKKLPVTGW